MTEVTRDDVGKACVFYDPRGRAYAALITAVHGPQCVNVVYVNDVEGQTDHYGQKLMRSASVMHGSIQQAWGNFWLLVGEARPPHTLPGYQYTPEGVEQRRRLAEIDSSVT